MTNPLALRPAEAAKYIGVGRTKLYELMDSGEIPSRRYKGMRLILVRDLDKWFNDLPMA